MQGVCTQHDLTWKTMQNEIGEIRDDVKEIKRDIKTLCTMDTRLRLLEKIVFGAVGVVLLAVVGALLGLVVLK